MLQPQDEPTVVSLCTGYGGLELGLALAGVRGRLVFVADPDPAAAKLLAVRYPQVPNFGDITAIDWAQTAQLIEHIDIFLAGYPCQGESLAGKRQGESDERWLWPDVADAIRHLRPRHVFLENVPGHRSMGFGRVLADLAALGYVGSWRSISASEVGAAHKRERLFIYAYPADTAGERHGDAGAAQLDRITAAPFRGGAATLLPTPAARLGISTSITPGAAANRQLNRNGKGLNLDDVIALLLPTPRASPNENRSTRRTPSQAAGKHGLYLSSEVCELELLPTPRASDGPKGGPNQHGSGGDLMLPSAVQPGRWGAYGPAIARWEAVIGRPAPEPTEPGKTTAVRLAPGFVEWLMGLPQGWATEVEGLTRNDLLRLCGNGVMPPQFAYAVVELYQDRVRREKHGQPNG